MADDIRIDIKVTGNQNVISAIKSTEGLEASVRKLSQAYDRGGISQAKAAKGIEQLAERYKKSEGELIAYGKAILKASQEQEKAIKVKQDAIKAQKQMDSIFALAAQKEKALAAAAKETANTLKKEKDARRALRMEFKEGYAAQVQYRAARMRLNQAEREGIVTAQQAAAAQKNLGVILQQGGRHMSRTGVMTQQAGYQVGDFLVQVQGGTNWMVAFGQQATQLVGALYMLPPAILTVSRTIFGLTLSVGTLIAVAGILIPLITAIGAYFMRTGESAKNTKKELSTLEEGVKSLTNSIEDWMAAKEAASRGISMEQLVGTKNIQAARVELVKLKKELDVIYNQDIGEGLSEDLSPTGKRGLKETAVKDAESLLNKLLLKQDEERLAVFREQKRELEGQAEIQRLSMQYGEESSQVRAEERRQEVEGINAAIDAQVRKSEITTAYGFILKLNNLAISNQTGLIEEANVKREKALEIAEAIADQEREYQDFLNERFTTNESITKELLNQIVLNAKALQYGKDSAEYKKAEADQARAAFEAELRKTTLTGVQIENAMSLYNVANDTSSVLASSEDSARGLAEALRDAVSAMASLSGFSAGLDKALTVSIAKVQALKSGADAAIAGTIAGMRVDLESKITKAASAGVDRSIVESMYGGDRSKISSLEASEKSRKSLEEANRGTKGSSGVGGGGGKTPDDPVKKLQDQLDLQKELIGKSEEYITVRNALGDSYSKIEPAQIANLQAQVVAIEAMKQAEADRKAIVDTVADSIGSGLTSIVDGTKSVKDAFKDMARAVIAELWKVFVVQKIVAGVKTLFGFADGGVFSGGAPDKKFANGGVVGGPTTFPMAGGKTGLMGEAGPEAIMPLKRGKNGKLGVSAEGGGSQPVVVNQYFSFQANGDESVKKIIAQAAPSISAMAQKGMMDQRRRGGAMKSTFG